MINHNREVFIGLMSKREVFDNKHIMILSTEIGTAQYYVPSGKVRYDRVVANFFPDLKLYPDLDTQENFNSILNNKNFFRYSFIETFKPMYTDTLAMYKQEKEYFAMISSNLKAYNILKRVLGVDEEIGIMEKMNILDKINIRERNKANQADPQWGTF